MKYSDRFAQHLASVDRLISFDRDLLDVAILEVRKLHGHLVKVNRLENPLYNGARTLEILEGIREHDSLRSRYELIFNQALVLLVSYFGSTIGDMVRAAIVVAVDKNEPKLSKEEIPISLGDLRSAGFDLRERVGEMVVQRRDISFQDMQSIHRALKDLLGIEVIRDDLVNDLILVQAARHVIVHAGGIVDGRLIKQVASAAPRQIKQKLTIGEIIQFSDSEVRLAGSQMRGYVARVETLILARYS